MRYWMWILAVIAATVGGNALAELGSDKETAAASAPVEAKELTLQEKVATLEKGKTTYDEAVRALGTPATTGDGPNDTHYAVWAKTGWFGGSYIVRLSFNKDGVLVNKMARQN